MGAEQQDTINPIVEVGLVATENDRFYQDDIQYIGLYHRHLDGTLMAGSGSMGEVHEMDPSKIIIGTTAYVPAEDIQEVREIVSDLFYKFWFESNTLTDEQVLSLQTTIRDGKKQTARTENEPLVFYKKDRNTLENREDLKNQAFNDICEDIFDNEISIHDIPEKFTFLIEEEHPRLRKKDKSIRSGTATVADDEPIIDSNTEDGNVY